MSRMRLGVIGCGLISHAHALAARNLAEEAVIISACSRKLSDAQNFATTYGIEFVFDNVSKMLNEVALDAVVICTGPIAHADIIFACLDAGIKHILCEKPLIVETDLVVPLLKRVTELKANVMEGFMYRHTPAFLSIAELSSQYGRIDMIEACFNMMPQNAEASNVMAYSPKDASPSKSWRLDAKAAGGVAYDFLCYPVDVVISLMRDLPVRVMASGSLHPENGTNDRISGIIEFQSGGIAMVSSSRKSTFSQRVEINCAYGQISCPVVFSNPSKSIVRVATSPKFIGYEERQDEIEPNVSTTRLIELEAFSLQMQHFIDLFHGRARPRLSLKSSLINAVVIEALIVSFVTAAPKSIDLPYELLDAFVGR